MLGVSSEDGLMLINGGVFRFMGVMGFSWKAGVVATVKTTEFGVGIAYI